jgi:CRP/FNR family transcriptional regulator
MECSHNQDCNKDKTCISRVPIFSGLSWDEIMEIANITGNLEFKKGQIIFLTGDKIDKLYVINQGKVKISKISEDGKEQIIRILEPGDFMGELSLFKQSPLNNNAEALEPTIMCVIEGEKLKNIIYKNPGISIKIMEELSNRLEQSDKLIERLVLHDVESRVADILLSLFDCDGKVNLSISKKDLASHIGMSQETLSRKLSHFQSMGWIKQIGQRQINILDRKSLQNIANY